MHYHNEQARTQTLTAVQLIRRVFGERADQGCLDAEFRSAQREQALGFAK